MKRRSLQWLDNEGKDLATVVVKEHDTENVIIRQRSITFMCDDKTMLSIISSLRNAINVTILIVSI